MLESEFFQLPEKPKRILSQSLKLAIDEKDRLFLETAVSSNHPLTFWQRSDQGDNYLIFFPQGIEIVYWQISFNKVLLPPWVSQTLLKDFIFLEEVIEEIYGSPKSKRQFDEQNCSFFEKGLPNDGQHNLFLWLLVPTQMRNRQFYYQGQAFFENDPNFDFPPRKVILVPTIFYKGGVFLSWFPEAAKFHLTYISPHLAKKELGEIMANLNRLQIIQGGEVGGDNLFFK